MQSTQSASISSSERGNGDRLGVRTRKKHKRLDAISEDVFNRNRNVEMGSSDGLELRRSSRVRKAPQVLDSSPAPKRKRRKIERFGREGGRGGLRGKGKAGNESGSSDEELGAWRLRSNTRLRMKGRSSRGKRKLRFKNGEKEDEDEEEEEEPMRDDLEDKKPCSDGEKLGDEEDDDDKVDYVGGSKDNESEMEDDRSMEENGVDDLGNNLTVGKGDVNEDSMEVLANTVVEENVDRNDHTGGSGATEKGTENQLKDTEGDPSMPTDLAENKNNDMTKDIEVEVEVRRGKTEGGVGVKVKSSNVDTGGIPRPRVKEGRRCGLCGGGTDGKPPKKLVTDSAGSDQEAYSGSSASEEFNYDAWDGFGDEPGWLGRLLGPVNDRLGIARIWVHQHCAVWSPEVYFAGLGRLKNIRAALCRGRALKCTRCGRPGATLGCRVDRCPRTYHLPCARASGCNFDHRKFMIACADHRYLFEPHGQQYSQRLKKLKAKKMKLEIRKLSNDASRKDFEAEEKWMEKCGEDEEFLRRETKRLQRDLVRIAPIYIGGSHSEGENPIGGWESVAGLQDVVQCMKEVVILPLLYPEFFQNMGITPPRGVLLHGYPGTGKTLIVRALIGSCARGDKRIAYFARKGADCLGKYVGDAERQLRLLFQVAEKSQPSIIFFDEIDGLAPVRTRQQDQTHSSVVSTLLALMDGLKSRGSVIVIGATNRPDSVDPALRRPGRFDREIYFPLPSVKDRAAILALHTRKWPKPVSGPLLEWVSTQTVGFAGADLQALCSQAAVLALKRNCSWNQILSCAAENPLKGRRPELPSFVVEERDWLEALSLAPPPCSRREAGMAANEVLGTPLDIHLTPCLLQPLLSLITSLYLDDRHWLPFGLVAAGRAIKKAVDSQMAEKNLLNDKWSSLAQKLAEDPNFAREIVSSLLTVGIVKGDEPLTRADVPKDISSDDGETHPCSFGVNPSGLLRNVGDTSLKKTGYRIMISGAPRSGQKHLASCLLHCFLGNVEVQKIDLATISQEGHGDMEQGILRILMKCASQRMCVIFMPRIDFWAVESCNQSLEQDVEASPVHESPKESSELVATPDIDNGICNVSKIWKIFREQLECLCVSSSLIILATSELPCADLPGEICQFFGNQPLASEGLKPIEYGSSRFCVEVNGEVDHNKLIHLSAIDLSRNLIQQFVHVAHMGSHHDSHSSVAQDHSEVTGDISACETHLRSIKEPGAVKQPSEDSATKSQTSSVYKNVKEKSTLVVALTTFGYQILRFPHFAELCWVTSKLNEGPSADICGPWKGWPFNSCIVRPCLPMQKDVVACNSNNINGKGKFTLVRGLIAVALSAYRGVYKSSREVSLDVRKVLELLVGQISARIQAGKNKYQYIRLLSQVAFLEDMVNNWSNSLKSLEPDDQIPVIATSAEDHQVTVESMAVEANPHIESGDVLGTQLATGGILGSTAEDPVDIDLNVPACSTQGDDFQKPEFVEGGIHGSLAENSHLSDLMTEAVGAGDRTNFVIIDEMSSGKADIGVDNPTDSAITNEVSPVKAVSVNNQNYVEIMDEMPQEKTVDVGVDNRTDVQSTHENSQEITVSLNHKDPQNFPAEEDVNQDSPDKMPLKSEIVCFYCCCTVCISTLQKSLEELIIQERERSGSCCTLEDIHDLISSLSTKLCSAVRNVYSTGESRNLVYRKPNSEISMNFESQSSSVNQCRSSECGLSELTDCIYHSESKTSSSSYDQPGFHSRYIFRDGVLVSGAPEESSFHCRCNALSLSSLIELILCTKQPTD